MTTMAKTEERDHVDRFLEENDLPGVDLEVEGIVDRINGIRRRFHRMLDETLVEFGLAEGEWKALNQLRLAGPPHRRSPGQLSEWAELSSGAMTNRIDRLEHAGLVRRLPDPDDRRGVIVRLTREGKAAVDGAFTALIEAEKALLADLPAAHQKELAGLLRRLLSPFGEPAAE